MKHILWMTIWTVCLLGCEQKEVGYLITDEAAYPVNRMEIYNINTKITELQQLQADFNEVAAPVRERYDRLNADYKAKQEEFDHFVRYEVQTVQDSISFILDKELDADQIEQLKQRLEEVLYPERDRLNELVNIAQLAMQKVEREIEDLCTQMGIASVVELDEEIAELERRIKYHIPWSTSTIEGVLGTEPLVYEIVSIHNDAHPEDAAKFLPYTGMMGGGRIYVTQDLDVSAGEYVLTIRVSNEGWSKVLENAFTFVVTE